MTPGRGGGQAERSQHGLGQLLAVQCAGHGPAYPVVGERSGLAVQRELGVGGLQRLAHDIAAQGLLLGGVLADRLGCLLAGNPGGLGLLLVRAVGLCPGLERPGRSDGGAGPLAELLAGRTLVLPGLGDAVRRGAVDLGEIEAAGGEGRGALVARHGGQHQLLQLGPRPPPARVAYERGRARLRVEALELEGAGRRPERHACAVIEGGRGPGHFLGVERREEGLPVRVRLLEGDLDFEIVGAAFDLLDPLVAGVAGRPVRRVLAAQRSPLRDEVGRADLAAVAPHRLLVELEEDDLLGLALDDLRGLDEVGIALRPSAPVEGEQGGEHGTGDTGRGGVRVGLEGVERGGHRVDGPAQGAAFGDQVTPGGRDVLGRGPCLVRIAGAAARQDGQSEHPTGEKRDGTERPGACPPAWRVDLGHGLYLIVLFCGI